jgi:hypothetical protein
MAQNGNPKKKSHLVLKLGDVVKLKPKALRLFKKTDGELFAGREVVKAKVVYIFEDTQGLVRLEQKLGGYWTWSTNDLEVAS